MTSPAIAETRERLLAERDRLQAKRGAAILDRTSFDGHARLGEIERELGGLDAADAEWHRRQIEGEAAAQARRVAMLRVQVREADDARMAALAEAETAFKDAVDHLEHFLEHSATIARLASALSKTGVPSNLAMHEIRRRASHLAAAALAALVRPPNAEFGDVTWTSFSARFIGSAWADVERAATGASIALLKGE